MIGVDKDILLIERFATRAEELLPVHPSLFSGLGGLSLLYAEMFNLTQNSKYAKRSIDLVEQSINLLNDKNSELTLVNGVAGVGWLVKYLIKSEVLSGIDEDILSDFDELLIETLKDIDFVENKTYDLLYGLIGKGIYFLEDKRIINKEALHLILQRLVQISSKSLNEEITWYDSMGREKLKTETDYFNYGLAHGIPSIIIFLSQLWKRNIEPKECSLLIRSLIDQIQATKLIDKESSYPSNSLKDEASKLSWCYGDIGIAIAFLKASEVLCNKNLEMQALNILISSARRKLDMAFIRTSGKLVENGFCHGTYGLSYLFNQAYLMTNQKELKEASNYWLSSRFSKTKSKSYDTLSNRFDFDRNSWEENGTLIEGYCGMGLVLLALKSNKCNALGNITLTSM